MCFNLHNIIARAEQCFNYFKGFISTILVYNIRIYIYMFLGILQYSTAEILPVQYGKYIAQ